MNFNWKKNNLKIESLQLKPKLKLYSIEKVENWEFGLKLGQN